MTLIKKVELHEFKFPVNNLGNLTGADSVGAFGYSKGEVSELKKFAIKIIGTIYIPFQYSSSPIKITLSKSNETTIKTKIDDPIITNVSKTRAYFFCGSFLSASLKKKGSIASLYEVENNVIKIANL